MTRRAALLLAVLAVVGAGAVATATAGTTASAAPAAENATLDHDGDELTLEAAGGQVVSGTTTLPPGSEVTVRLRAADGESRFVKEKTATVQDDGAFLVLFDLTIADPGQNVTAAVHGPDGERLVERFPGTVVEGDVDLGLADHDPSVRSGGTATLSVHVEPGTTAALVVEGRETDYRLAATVTDGDGDGVVDVRFDTAVAGTGGDPLSAADPDDAVRVDDETALDGALPADHYGLSLGLEDATVHVGTLAVEGTGATATATPTPTEPPARSGHPQLDPTVSTVDAGRVLELSVSLGNASAATLSLGAPETNYVLNATVRDGDGDNVVVLRFDTAAAGTDGATLSTVADADAVTVTHETDLAGPPVDPGEYKVSLYRGTGTTGSPVDIGTVLVQEAPAGTTRTATPTPTPTTPTGTVSPRGGLAVDPSLLALGGIAVAGLGAAVVLSLRR